MRLLWGWLALLLLVGSTRQGWLVAAADAKNTSSNATAPLARDCPAEVVLGLLRQQRDRQLPLQLSLGDGDSGCASAQAAAAALTWPPAALKQGLTCTMELSQLSVAIPGTNTVCTVMSITNNLLSILYSWQLVWQPASQGVGATAATGSVLLNNTGAGDSTVQLINPPTSASIAARGGSVDMLVQLELAAAGAASTAAMAAGVLASPLPAPPSQPQPAAAEGKGDKGGGQGKAPKAAAPGPAATFKPAIESVYLNGLQCTRLPLARGEPSSLNLDDCGTAEWSLDSLAPLDSLNISSSSSSGSGNGSAVSLTDVAGVLAALKQLACVSQLCCGLQVVPSSVVSIGNSSSDSSNATANSTEPPVLATDGPSTPALATQDNTSLAPGSEPLPADIMMQPSRQPTQQPNQPQPGASSGSITGLVVGLVVAGVMTGCLGALVLLLLRHRHNRNRRLAEALKQQASAVQQGLVRHGSGASSGSGGAASLASVASAEWQQHQQQHYATAAVAASARPPVPWLRGPGPGPAVQQPYVLPTHRTAPPHLIGAAAAAATAEMSAGAAGVWRAGSWQGPDAYTHAGHQLERSSSGPQPLLRTTTASSGTPLHLTQPAALMAASGSRSSPSSPSAPALHLLSPSGPGLGLANSQPSVAFGASSASGSAAAGAFSPAVMAGASAGSSPRDAAMYTANSSLGSTWGSLRRMLGHSRPLGPISSTLASGTSSSSGLMRHGSGYPAQGYDSTDSTMALQPGTTVAAALAASAHREQLSLTHCRPPLQLIQEAAPLSGASFPAQAYSQQQMQVLAGTRVGFGGSYLVPSGSGPDAGNVAVSRRISPILSVHEDASSATSTDSMTPAAWQLTDRQMLEDTPGWLNIDFSSEVRLEKKLGEGGFGQVFRARWRNEVIAAKLVPFMSLVAQQHHSMSVSLVSAAVDTPDAAAAAAAGQRPPRHGGGTDGSQLSSMRLGVQFSSASLRAIKVEIRVLSQLSHPNIVAFKGACMAPPHICILEQLAEGGSLWSRLYSRSSTSKAQQQQRQRQQQAASSGSSSSAQQPPPRSRKAGAGGSSSSGSGRSSLLPPPLSVCEVLRIATDVSRAMVYLHTLQPQVVHRDLKPQNVLLDLQGRAKVCDFGISKMKDASLAASSTRLQAGTPAYMAPEQFEGCSVTDKVDVFAFGVLLWECLEQQQPWKELSPMQIIYSVGLQKERLQRPARCPDRLWQLIEECWAQDPRDRPSFAETLQTLQQLQQQQHQQQQSAAGAAHTKQQQPGEAGPAAPTAAEGGLGDTDAHVTVVC